MALICPRCETRNPANFFIVKGKISGTYADQIGPGNPFLAMNLVPEQPTCKNCNVALVDDLQLAEDKARLRREQNPDEMAKYNAEHAMTPWETAKLFGFGTVIIGSGCVFLWLLWLLITS